MNGRYRQSLWRFRWRILLVWLLFLILGIAAAIFRPTVHEARVMLAVVPSATDGKPALPQSLKAKEYYYQLKNLPLEYQVSRKLDPQKVYRLTPGVVRMLVRVKRIPGSGLIIISARHRRAQTAQALADTWAEVFLAETRARMQKELQEETGRLETALLAEERRLTEMEKNPGPFQEIRREAVRESLKTLLQRESAVRLQAASLRAPLDRVEPPGVPPRKLSPPRLIVLGGVFLGGVFLSLLLTWYWQGKIRY